MPRQSRSSRPSTSRPAPKPASAPSRGASTAALPAQHAPPAPAPPANTSSPAQTQTSSQGPGMLAQMAATAGSVAVGSTIGHGISSMLFGGRSEPAPAEQQQAAPQQNTSSFASNCEVQAKDFSKCIEKADLQSCSWYLEQLKACQAAASQFSA